MPSLAQAIGIATPIFAWAPKGYREMMKLPRYQHLSMWKVRPDGLANSSHLKWALAEVTEQVNRSAMYVADDPGKDVWGPWKLVNGFRVGDCDDYAVHKLQALVARGYPRGALRLAICQIGLSQVYHCVLLVYLDDGDAVILDNRTESLWRKRQRGNYIWISEEWPGHDFWWRKLK
jgi:predicted transglutaminase-like cysteine proteinase